MTLAGKPYPNGRNQESASESIAAYEAVALYGDVMVRNCWYALVFNFIYFYIKFIYFVFNVIFLFYI